MAKSSNDERPAEFSASKIKALRKRLGLTQVQAAEKIGVAPRTWISWENNHRTPSAAAVKLLQLLSQGSL